MKKLLTITLSLIISCSFAQWEWQNPLPQGNTLNDVFILNHDMGWAVGELGIIIRTLDGGETFEILDSNIQVNLNAIEFFSPLHGFIVGDNGTVLETDNGGESWNVILDGFTSNLNDLYLASPNRIWIGGDNGHILHSNNGGETWDLQYDDSTTFINSIYFLNENSGWAAGKNDSSEGLILRTDDGGGTWTEIIEGVLHPFRTIHFTSSFIGWAIVSDQLYNQIYKTLDGGINWVFWSDHISIDDHFNDVYFTDQNNGWIIGESESVPVPVSLIYHTNDGGETWNGQNSGLIHGLNSIYFSDSENGCAVGSYGDIVHTSNSGYSWSVTCGSSDRTLLTDVFFVDQNQGWTVGGGYYPFHSEILYTDDGGGNWYEQEAPVSFLTSVYFIDQYEGWITGTGTYPPHDINLIIHTTNGGGSWETQYYESGEWYSHALKDIVFLDTERGWAVGGSQHVLPPEEQSILLYTSDGGENWDNYSYLIDKSLSAVCFVDPDNGWIAGHETILKTTDGGQTWNELWTGIHSFQDICFVDNDHGWVIGDSISMMYVSDVVMRTTDGGITWEKQYFKGSYEKMISFNDINHGWIACDERLYYTIDGGVTWQEQFSGAQSSIRGVFFIDNNNGWVVGSNSTILHTSNGGIVSDEESPLNYISVIKINCYPNPFSVSTTLSYELKRTEKVTLSIYNHLGQIVYQTHENQPQGNQQLIWSAEGYSDGIYYYRLQVGDAIANGKMMKIR